MQVFYNIINLAVINSLALYRDVNQSKIKRRQFIIELIEEIVEIASGSLLDETRMDSITRPSEKEKTKTLLTPILNKRKLSHNHNESPRTPKRVLYCNENNEYIDDKKVHCQIKSNCTNNKAFEICSMCKKSSCCQCIIEKVVKAKCAKCVNSSN